MDAFAPHLETAFARALDACGLQPDDPLLVGFSGGVDSLALVLLLHKIDRSFTAIHLHHGLRGAAADEDAAWCLAFCRRRGIACECHRLAVERRRAANGESLEAAARQCRLDFWRERAGTAAVVALGHHADDALETLLLRLARGANASGLTGLRRRRAIDGVRMVRPLLEFRRAELVDYVRGEGIEDWRRDASNDDPRHRRNAVRHQWLPKMRATLAGEGGLWRSLAALREDADFLEAAAAAATPETSDADAFRSLHPALLPRVLRGWLQRETGRDWLPRHQAIERLREELGRVDESTRRIPLGDGLALVLEHGRLRPMRETCEYDLDWHWREESRLSVPGANVVLEARPLAARDVDLADVRKRRASAVYFPANGMPTRLRVRNWRPGDRIVPFGHAGERKVKDIFSAAGIAADLRPLFPLVFYGQRLLWIAGIKRAADYPVVGAEAVVAFERM